jgi:hypothetical protein
MQKVSENAQELNLEPLLKCDSCGLPVSADTPIHPDLGPSCAACLERDEQCSRFEDFGYRLADVLALIPGRDRGLLFEIRYSIESRLKQHAETLTQSGWEINPGLELDRLPEQTEQEFAQRLAALLVGSFSSGLVNQLRSEIDHLVVLAGQEVRS